MRRLRMASVTALCIGAAVLAGGCAGENKKAEILVVQRFQLFIWFIFLWIIAFLLKYPLWIVAGAASSENIRFCNRKAEGLSFLFGLFSCE